eukprot:m.129899 g.129899  ORF g.129899 m.129899 type:complete len:444 (+) comp16770_c0_seq2:119-1450(+)
MLKLSVFPGQGVGHFILGHPIGLVTQVLKEHYTEYAHVELAYSDASPLAVETLLHLPDLGVQLVFDTASQRLKTIDVFDTSKVQLTYNGKDINSPTCRPTFKRLYETIGATSGVENKPFKQYVLTYPGLTLLFPIPLDFEEDIDLPSTQVFPDGSMPMLSNLCVHRGKDMQTGELPPVSETRILSTHCPSYGQPVDIHSGRGITLSGLGCDVCFGMSCQDVITLLGTPDDRFFKTEDRMRIHRSQQLPTSGASRADYFFNYFALGLDVLFDAQTHVVKKFVFHSNLPGHYDFGCYYRCNYRITLPRVSYDSEQAGQQLGGAPAGVWVESVVSQQPEPTSLSATPSADLQSIDLDLEGDDDAAAPPATADGVPPGVFVVTPATKWDDVQHHLGSSCGKPVVFHRAESANTVDPFGATLFFSHNDLIFEVMHNQHIATVTLFQPT